MIQIISMISLIHAHELAHFCTGFHPFLSTLKITMMQVGEKIITGVKLTPARTFLSPQLGTAKREADMFAGVLDECYKCV